MQSIKNINKDLSIINYSVSSVSSGIQRISKRKKCFIYGVSVKNSIKQAKKVLEKKPDYLLKVELDYLSYFVKVFESSHIHGIYRLKYRNFLEIYNKAFKSLEARSKNERNRVVEIGKSIDIESKIQLSFELVHSNFILIEKKIKILKEKDKFDPNRIKSLMRGIGQIVNHLTQCYHFETCYIISSQEFDLSDLNDFIDELNEFNNSIMNEDSFIDFFQDFVGEYERSVYA